MARRLSRRPGELEAVLAKLSTFRSEADTRSKPFRIFATDMGAITADRVRRHVELGGTDMVVVFRNLYAVEEDRQPLDKKIDGLKRFADEVISKIG